MIVEIPKTVIVDKVGSSMINLFHFILYFLLYLKVPSFSSASHSHNSVQKKPVPGPKSQADVPVVISHVMLPPVVRESGVVEVPVTRIVPKIEYVDIVVPVMKEWIGSFFGSWRFGS